MNAPPGDLLTPSWFREISGRLDILHYRLLPGWWCSTTGLVDAANGVPDENARHPGGTVVAAQSAHTIQLLDSQLHAPYILQEAFTVERQLPKNTTISESYVNSHGLHELRSDDINAPLLGTYTGPGTGVYPLYAPVPDRSGAADAILRPV